MPVRESISWSRAGIFVAALAVVTTVAFADGGYFRGSWLWITLALCSLAGLALLLRDEIEIGRLELVALTALALLSGWTALSATWSSAPTSSLHDAERGLIYVAALLAYLLLTEKETSRTLLAGVAVGAIVVAGYGLGDRIATGSTTESDPVSGTRLIEPLGYANALAILGAIGIVLALGLAWSAATRGERIVWVLGVPLLAAALALTESRGTVLALVVGLAVFAHTRSRHPLVLATVGVVLVTVVVGAVVAVDRALGSRVDYWHVAWDEYEDNPVLGSGAGTFQQYWEQTDMPVLVRDAHSLYLETLAELGPLGLGVVLVALGLPLLAGIAARGDPTAGIAVSAYAVFLVHAGLDWDWEMPAVTLAGISCAAVLLVAMRQPRNVVRVGLAARSILAFAVVALAALAVVTRTLIE
jgi:O-antigen ligase